MGPGSPLAALAPAGTTVVGLLCYSSHPFNSPFTHTFPLRGPHSPRFSFLLPAPVKGWAERREARISPRACEAR